MKKVILFFIALTTILQLAAQEQTVRNAFEKCNDIVPEEKIYVHTDRTLYSPGETLWFKAYLTDASLMKSPISSVLYVELINPKGNVERKLPIARTNDIYFGEFDFPTNAPGGLYKIRAYTEWMKNQGEENYFFEKEITLQSVVLPNLLLKLDYKKEAYGAGEIVEAQLNVRTKDDLPLINKKIKAILSLGGKKVKEFDAQTDREGNADINFKLPADLITNDGLLNLLIAHEGSTESISRSVPIVLNNIDIQFFAEGGDLIDGITNKLAFKALDEFGKPADISGYLQDNSGHKILDFKSFHQGMGAFEFSPKLSDKYLIKITKPAGISKSYSLPDIQTNSYGLRVIEQEKNKLTLSIFSPKDQQVNVLARIGKKLEQIIPFVVKKGENKLTLPIDKMGMGILQLTLLDQSNLPQCERLVFVNKHRTLNIDIKTDQSKYFPREDVKINLTITDETGKGVEGDFSMAVVDDRNFIFADDKQDNILSCLLMSSDLKGTVEEPNFYFDDNEEKADEAIDYVMLTHGWRRFTWKDILTKSESDWKKTIQHQADELSVMGKLLVDGKPLSGIRVWTDGHKQMAKTDKNGIFAFTNVSVPLTVHARHRGFKATQTIHQYAVKSILESQLRNREQAKDRLRKNKVFAAVDAVEDLRQEVAMVEVEEQQMEQDDFADADGVIIAQAEKKEVAGDKFMMADEMAAGKVMALNEVVVIMDEPALMDAKGVAPADAMRAPVAGIYRPAVPNQAHYTFSTTASTGIPQMYIQGLQTAGYFHHSRQFYAPRYNNAGRKYIQGTDTRKTLYWNPNIQTDNEGKTEFVFSNADLESTYRIILEGISGKGVPIRHEGHTYATQKPVSFDAKIPVAVTHGDLLNIPISIKNNSDKEIKGVISSHQLHGMIVQDKTTRRTVSIPSGKHHTEYFKLQVDKTIKGLKNMQFSFEHPNGTENIVRQIEVNPKGFPRAVSLSSKELQRSFDFNVNDILDNSLTGMLNIYPNIMEELLSGTESIIREPHGCFEQTSSSNYPNIMVLQYMQQTGKSDPAMENRALEFLKKGYGRLAGYECSKGGFEWWGKDPAHETLTAYGLLQFNDMKKVYKGVDEEMIQRTKNWLLEKRDGKGGFKHRSGGLDSFRGSSYEVGNAYITYALTETGNKGLEKEVAFTTAESLKSKDAYRLSLAALSNFNIGNDTKAEECLSALKEQFKFLEDEKIQVNETVTRSYGNNRFTETAALYASGLMRQKKADMAFLDKLIIFLSGKRSGHGGFGSTQATILALKAFTDYAKIMGKTDKSGRIRVYANEKQIFEFNYNKGHRGKIQVDLTPHLKTGENNITVSFDQTTEALPYSADISWTSLTPESSPACRVDLMTSLATENAKVGETVRMTAKVKNIHDDEIPTPIALIGIPAGLSLQPWQLKELTEKEVMDYYEIRGNYLIAYFTGIKKGKERIINLDLKADIPGDYKAPASTAYLYYDKQDKDWEKGTVISITN